MSLKSCFILGAGFGTRMGEIGKILPKTIWPLFEKTLLEMQIEVGKRYGCETFFVNAHHGYEKVLSLVERKNLDIKVFHEPLILGSGGAFLNLKEKGVTGPSLFLNADIFYDVSDQIIKEAFEVSRNHSFVLFSKSVSKEEGYNEIILDAEECLSGILKGSDKEKYLTYSGMGIVNFDLLPDLSGKQNFFPTVCRFKESKIPILSPIEKTEYVDFGTKELYLSSIQKTLKGEFPKFLDFLKSSNILDERKMSQKNLSYNADGQRNINFGNSRPLDFKEFENITLLEGELKKGDLKEGIYFNDLRDD